MTQTSQSTAWLLYSSENRVHAGNDGYDDRHAESYLWDDTVPNHSRIREGDIVVLWDGSGLLGISAVCQLSNESSSKARYRCPKCNTTNIRRRTNRSPKYRCGNCRSEFPQPVEETIDVKTYRADYGPAWYSLPGRISGTELRSICLDPLSQHSLRPLDVERFKEMLRAHQMEEFLGFLFGVQRKILGGYRRDVVRTRIGQGSFREELLRVYGSVCAISGPAPPQAIQACHLYSYAKLARHEVEGGLLLRSDLHTMFDRGLIKVDPSSDKVRLHPELQQFPDYWRFDGSSLKTNLTSARRQWLSAHWDQHPFEVS